MNITIDRFITIRWMKVARYLERNALLQNHILPVPRSRGSCTADLGLRWPGFRGRQSGDGQLASNQERWPPWTVFCCCNYKHAHQLEFWIDCCWNTSNSFYFIFKFCSHLPVHRQNRFDVNFTEFTLKCITSSWQLNKQLKQKIRLENFFTLNCILKNVFTNKKPFSKQICAYENSVQRCLSANCPCSKWTVRRSHNLLRCVAISPSSLVCLDWAPSKNSSM